MTTQEQDLQRLKAWDTYNAEKAKFLACRQKLINWAEPLSRLAQKLIDITHEVHEGDAQLIPNQGIFQTAVQEFREAKVKFERSRAEAQRFNWPVAADDMELLTGKHQFEP